MSIVMDIVAAASDAADGAMAKPKRVKPSGKKVYKTRIATKIKWALEDATERASAAQEKMKRILAQMEKVHQAQALDAKVLGRLEHELFGLALDVAELERIVSAAVRESRPDVTGK